MLWPVTSSERCCARIPRSAVSSPRKEEIGTLGPRVEDVEGLRRVRPAAGRVAGLRRAGEHAHQVVEEAQLLADQDAVLVVHTADLEQQAAELGAREARGLRLGGRCDKQDGL